MTQNQKFWFVLGGTILTILTVFFHHIWIVLAMYTANGATYHFASFRHDMELISKLQEASKYILIATGIFFVLMLVFTHINMGIVIIFSQIILGLIIVVFTLTFASFQMLMFRHKDRSKEPQGEIL